MSSLPELYVKCNTCGIEFKTDISYDKESLKTAILRSYVHTCPKGHSNTYNKENYYFKE